MLRINSWGSHVGLLYYSLLSVEGTVVELGTGLVSTPLLHSLCCLAGVDRKVVSFEVNENWVEQYRSFAKNPNHEVYHDVDGLETNKYERYEWKPDEIGIVLVDSGDVDDFNYYDKGYTNRLKAIRFFKPLAKIIIVHDTHGARLYGMKEWPELVSSFKYCATDKKEEYSWTTAFSDVFDVENCLLPELSLRKAVEVIV